MAQRNRRQRTYDHRLRDLVRSTADVAIVVDLGVPRSTASGWLRQEPREVVTVVALELTGHRQCVATSGVVLRERSQRGSRTRGRMSEDLLGKREGLDQDESCLQI